MGLNVRWLSTWHHRQLLLEDDSWPLSRVTSVVCSHAFGLAKYLDTLTDGGGVMPTPECRNPNPYGMVCVCACVCVSWDCFPEDAMYGLMSLGFWNALICRWLQPYALDLCIRSSLVGSGLSVWLRWRWLLAPRACHWVGSRGRTLQKAKSQRTEHPEFSDSWVPAHSDRFFLVLNCSQSMRACTCLPNLSWLPLCVSLFLKFSKQLRQHCCFFMPLSCHSARDDRATCFVSCYSYVNVWDFPGILPVHCSWLCAFHSRFTPLLAPRTP